MYRILHAVTKQPPHNLKANPPRFGLPSGSGCCFLSRSTSNQYTKTPKASMIQLKNPTLSRSFEAGALRKVSIQIPRWIKPNPNSWDCWKSWKMIKHNQTSCLVPGFLTFCWEWRDVLIGFFVVVFGSVCGGLLRKSWSRIYLMHSDLPVPKSWECRFWSVFNKGEVSPLRGTEILFGI